MNVSEINRIKDTLNSKSEKKYYVYMLCDETNTPFYIGKGAGERVWQHEKAVEEIKEKIDEMIAEIENDKNLTDLEKQAKIKVKKELIEKEINAKQEKIKELGEDKLKKIIVKWGLTENEAFMAESALINAYTLTNGRESLTNIVNGHMSKPEKDNLACETKARTIEEFLKDCAVEEKSITELDVPVMFAPINTSYADCKELDENEQEKAIYDCARAAWIIGKDVQKHLSEVQYVFAMYKSKVVGIYPVDKSSWKTRRDIAQENSDNSYDFPKYPKGIREKEKVYAEALKNCKTEDDVENEFKKIKCKKSELTLKEYKEINPKDKVGVWLNRMFFEKADKKIPTEVLDFKDKRIRFPKKNSEGTRSLGQKEYYNFEPDKGGEVKMKQYT